MTKKKDIIEIKRLGCIKKRRMQKFHARKILRFFKEYGCDPLWINSLKKVMSILKMN